MRKKWSKAPVGIFAEPLLGISIDKVSEI